MKFTKMHGLGNDFIIIESHLLDNIENTSDFARKICSRRLGIGADGLIISHPSQKADIKMQILNSDGSRADICINGMRCLAKYAYEKINIGKKIFTIEDTAGILHQAIYLNNKEIEIEVGKPVIIPSQIPVTSDENKPVIDRPLFVNGTTFHISCVSMGNPHCIIFKENLEDIPLEEIGPLIENHEIFPQKTNVEFAKVIDRKNISMLVWERGVGRTPACGSGASAVLVAGVLNNFCERSVNIRLEGGELKVRWKDDDIICLRGPCEEIFQGDINIEKLSDV